MAPRFKSSCNEKILLQSLCAVIALNCLITVTNVPKSVSQDSEDEDKHQFNQSVKIIEKHHPKTCSRNLLEFLFLLELQLLFAVLEEGSSQC